MSYPFSLALVISDANRVNANLLACVLGHDVYPGNTYSVPLAATAEGPATHWGCHSWVQQSFLDLLAGAAQGSLPPVDWSEVGLTEQDILVVLSDLKASPPQTEPLNFDEWIATHGLVRVQEEI